MELNRSEHWFLQVCFQCGTGNEVHSIKNGAPAYKLAGRTFTYSDILEYGVYDNLAEVNGLKLAQLTVLDKFTLMIDAYFLLSRLTDRGLLELLDDSKESGLLYRVTDVGGKWFEENTERLHPTWKKDDHIFFDSWEDMNAYVLGELSKT